MRAIRTYSHKQTERESDTKGGKDRERGEGESWKPDFTDRKPGLTETEIASSNLILTESAPCDFEN